MLTPEETCLHPDVNETVELCSHFQRMGHNLELDAAVVNCIRQETKRYISNSILASEREEQQ